MTKAIILLLFFGGLWEAPAQTSIFVDAGLPAVACANYNPATRDCRDGTNLAFRTIAGAVSNIAPGVTIFIRGGTYSEPIVPPVSGQSNSLITYRSWPGEAAVITGANLDPAINLSHRSFIIIDAITLLNVKAWVWAEEASYDTIRYCTFEHGLARGARAGLRFMGSDYNRIQTNVLEDANDVLCFSDSSYNLIEGNTFRLARHALWNILCGNYNVVRHNSFSNEWQKIGQITDCEASPPGTPIKFDATKRNLVDGNTFEFTPASGNHAPFDGIQYCAQHGIIRRNYFFDTTGPAIEMTLYNDEARYNTGTRVYQNVFYGAHFAGVQISETKPIAFGDHVFKDNIFYRNRFAPNDTRWAWYVNDLAGQPVQIMAGRLDGYVFERNDILGDSPTDPYAVAYGSRFSSQNPEPHPLDWWQAMCPQLFTNNFSIPPGFVDEQAHDFRLTAQSPLRGAGAFLTRTVAAGQGVVIPVQDASYFYDGFGIPGEAGDSVQLEGQTTRARILHLDESANTVTVDHPLEWRAGEGIALPFEGAGPDIGVNER